MLKVENVTKRYGNIIANDNVSFELLDNQITILLGENGAGKSTIIKAITGFLNYDGTIDLDGKDAKDLETKKQIGFVPEVPELYGELTVWQQIQFVAYAYGIKDFEDIAEKYLHFFRIIDKKHELCGALSKGMKQKVSIISALVLNPRVLILDEPMVGLDPEAIRDLRNLLNELKSTCCIMLSTHIIDTVASIWDQALIMNKGKLVYKAHRDSFDNAEGSLEEIYFEKKGQ